MGSKERGAELFGSVALAVDGKIAYAVEIL
jgi:hypothetical protein